MENKPLVIGAPRSGFSLLISLIGHIKRRTGCGTPTSKKRAVIRSLMDFFSRATTERYVEAFASAGIKENLLFNGEFQLLVGGPKWLSPDDPSEMCVRTYLGAMGMGDFLLVTSHPRELFEYYDVLHSHTAPSAWVEDTYYDDFLKFSSLRNPLGIVNSAVHSINAMTSEYITLFLPGADEHQIRRQIALSKLSDLKVIRGLVRFLKDYLEEFLRVREHYRVMRWEDLIHDPIKTIRTIAEQLDVRLSSRKAKAIWKPLDHRNLLRYHLHNYRKERGIVGEWRRNLVNAHMDVFRDCGMEPIMDELGYGTIPSLSSNANTPLQKEIQALLDAGEVFEIPDRDLYGLAFNKSNIDTSEFNFKSFPKRRWSCVERSTFENDALVERVSDLAEETCGIINAAVQTIIDSDAPDDPRLIRDLRNRCTQLESDTNRFPLNIPH